MNTDELYPTNTSWQQTLLTPGLAIGKCFKTRDNNKILCINDLRTFNESKPEQPLVFVSTEEDSTLLYSTNGSFYSYSSKSDQDIIGYFVLDTTTPCEEEPLNNILKEKMAVMYDANETKGDKTNTKFNLGDTVLDIEYGWCKILSLGDEGDEDDELPIETKHAYYTTDGKKEIGGFLPVLLTIQEAAKRYPDFPPPKEHVIMWLAYDSKSKPSLTAAIFSTNLFPSEQLLDKHIKHSNNPASWVKTTVEIEL